jgi:MYXO-CTERM domain-containing protein
LTTGATTAGALVGVAGGDPAADFSGGFAVTYDIPEPATGAFVLAVAAASAAWRRRAAV